MSLVIPSHPQALYQVTLNELFYAHRLKKTGMSDLEPGRKICMMLDSYRTPRDGTLDMLVLDEDGRMRLMHPFLGSNSDAWHFERYLTQGESISIAGSDPNLDEKPVPAEAVPDMPEIPTHDRIRENRDVSLIPDGLYYRLSQDGSTIWQCVNCPPGKGRINEINSSKKDIRTITLVTSSKGGTCWSGIDILTHKEWDFVGYVMPDDVYPNMKAYPKP